MVGGCVILSVTLKFIITSLKSSHLKVILNVSLDKTTLSFQNRKNHVDIFNRSLISFSENKLCLLSTRHETYGSHHVISNKWILPPVFSRVRVTRSLVLCVCLEIIVCPFVFSLLTTVLSVLLRFTDYDTPLVSSNSSYSLLDLLFITIHGIPLMCVLRVIQQIFS